MGYAMKRLSSPLDMGWIDSQKSVWFWLEFVLDWCLEDMVLLFPCFL